MKKVVKLLVVILISLLVCVCLGVGGFYDVVVKTEEAQKPTEEIAAPAEEDATILDETQETEPALSEGPTSDGESEGTSGSTEGSLPDDTGKTEIHKTITITLGDFVINLLHLGAVRDYLGIDVFKRILICVAVGGAFIDGLLIAGLFRKTGRKSRKNHTDDSMPLKDDSQAIEGYRVPRNVNGLKF